MLTYLACLVLTEFSLQFIQFVSHLKETTQSIRRWTVWCWQMRMSREFCVWIGINWKSWGWSLCRHHLHQNLRWWPRLRLQLTALFQTALWVIPMRKTSSSRLQCTPWLQGAFFLTKSLSLLNMGWIRVWRRASENAGRSKCTPSSWEHCASCPYHSFDSQGERCGKCQVWWLQWDSLSSSGWLPYVTSSRRRRHLNIATLATLQPRVSCRMLGANDSNSSLRPCLNYVWPPLATCHLPFLLFGFKNSFLNPFL